MTKGRMEALSDGVFSVALTLLILDVRPEGAGLTGWEVLMQQRGRILVYLLSFMIVAVYWVTHHNMMYFVRAVNRTMLWLNLLLLLTVVFIPFVAALLSASHADVSAVRIYGAALILTNLAVLALWAYASRGGRLLHPATPASFVRFVTLLFSTPALVYALGILGAGFSRPLSFVLFALVPAFFILPHPWLARRIDRASQAIKSPTAEPANGP